LHEGQALFVEGRLKFDTWDDKQGGGKRSKLSVVVENFQFLPSPRDGGGDDRDGMDQRPEAGGFNRPNTKPGRAEQDGRQMFSQPDQRKGWRGQRAPAEKPYSDGDKQFAEADIPF
jgi:single-stranded DNA-binding protein